MSTWQSGKNNREVILALAFNTNTNAKDWEFLEDSTKEEWLDGAREWYFNHPKLGMAKVWYTKGRHCDSALMN
jgi:hypothetical protein